MLHAGGHDNKDALNSLLKAYDITHKSSDKVRLPICSMDIAMAYERKGDKVNAEIWHENTLAMLAAYRQEWIRSNMDKLFTDGQYSKHIDSTSRKHLQKLYSELVKTRPNREWLLKEIPLLEIPIAKKQSARELKELEKLRNDLDSGKWQGAHLHINLGVMYSDANKLNDAVVEYLTAIELDNKDSIAWDNLGWVYMLQGRLDRA